MRNFFLIQIIVMYNGSCSVPTKSITNGRYEFLFQAKEGDNTSGGSEHHIFYVVIRTLIFSENTEVADLIMIHLFIENGVCTVFQLFVSQF